jgi:hypothetical protein
MFDIGVSLFSLTSEHYFLSMTKSFNKKVIYGQALVTLPASLYNLPGRT